ncbi:MAG TPA: hypothetical protein VFV80_00770 [Geminicoccaceae bacterium]|nr:hypothetical protein [Geminicoccaceae bacterium]
MPLEPSRPGEDPLVRGDQRDSMVKRRRKDDPIGRVAMNALELRRHDTDLTGDRAFYQTACHEFVAPLPTVLSRSRRSCASSRAISQKVIADAASAPSRQRLLGHAVSRAAKGRIVAIEPEQRVGIE